MTHAAKIGAAWATRDKKRLSFQLAAIACTSSSDVEASNTEPFINRVDTKGCSILKDIAVFCCPSRSALPASKDTLDDDAPPEIERERSIIVSIVC